MKNNTFYFLALLVIFTNCKKDDEIIKKQPEISWLNPYDISYGTTLSEVQLNAISDIPGHFIYSPSLNTILPEGMNQELQVSFIPNDSETYCNVIKTVKINVIPSTILDNEGNVYRVVTIGNQIWMAENLKATRFSNGDEIPNVSTFEMWKSQKEAAYCIYNNENSNDSKYGNLYNGYVACDTRRIAPEGWHIPSKDDWFELQEFLGFENCAGKLKAITTWDYPNFGATDETRFSAVAGGMCGLNEYFYGLNKSGYFWTTDKIESSENLYLGIFLSFDSRSIGICRANRYLGFSIRCVRDR